MGSRGMYWLIGAKIAGCGALLLLLSGVLSLGALSALFSDSALPLAGAAAAVVALFLWHRSGHPSPESRGAEDDPQADRRDRVNANG